MLVKYYHLQHCTVNVFCHAQISTRCPSCSGCSQIKILEKFQKGLAHIELNSE